MKLLLLRPYYGINIHGDMHGDLGISDYMPHIFPDISLITAATLANQDDSIELTVIDGNAEKLMPDQIFERIDNDYDQIIVKSSAPTVRDDIDFCKELKSRIPTAHLSMGGHVAKLIKTWLGEFIPEIDAVITESLENYVYKLVHGPSSVPLLEKFPTPDFTLFNVDAYRDMNGILRGTLYTSRACPVGCNYCPYVAFQGIKWERRSLDKVIEDVKTLLNLGFTDIQFRDPNFGVSKKRVLEFCRMIIDNGLHFKWRCETVINNLDEETIDLMVEAGMDLICFGIESASEDTLNEFGRPNYNMSRNKELIEYIHSHNVDTVAFYILGFPDDTWEKCHQTYKLSTYIRSKYVKFSLYEDYAFNSEETAANQLDPEAFEPYTNNLMFNSSNKLSRKELTFLKDHFSVSYWEELFDIERAHRLQHVHIQKFHTMVDSLNKKKKLQNTLQENLEG